jgi:hypothetical protein
LLWCLRAILNLLCADNVYAYTKRAHPSSLYIIPISKKSPSPFTPLGAYPHALRNEYRSVSEKIGVYTGGRIWRGPVYGGVIYRGATLYRVYIRGDICRSIYRGVYRGSAYAYRGIGIIDI